MLFPFVSILLWVHCLLPDLLLCIQANSPDIIRMPKFIKYHAVGSERLRRNAISSSDCLIQIGHYPCLLRPVLKDIPTQRVLSERLSGKEFEIFLEAEERGIVYLPCSTLHELQNETVIWDHSGPTAVHNMSTIAVMGTPFTMDPRFYTSGPPENRFYRCSHTHSLFVPHRDFFDSQYLDPSDIFEAWELVIDGVQKKDSGVYHCRLTGKQPQSLLYHLTIKKSASEALVSSKRIVTISAPRYARRYSSANFTCSMEATHGDFSRVIIDWYRASSGHKSSGGQRMIENQAWNNISVYKEILGDSREGLRLNAVMQIHSSDYQHDGIYECQALQITLNERSRVYDSFSVTFTVLPQWQYKLFTRDWGLCRERVTEFPTIHEVPNHAFSRVVLSDSPTEKQQTSQVSVDGGRRLQPFPTQNWISFPTTGSLTSAANQHTCFSSPMVFIQLFFLLFFNFEVLMMTSWSHSV